MLTKSYLLMFSLFLFNIAQSALANSSNSTCLDEALENPRSTLMYADFFYEQEEKSQFAQKFFEQVQAKLNAETACTVVETQVQFNCVESNGSYPVCGAKVNDFFIAVIKDYVDSARLVVNRRQTGAYTWVPGTKRKYDDSTLYLPNSSYCYSALLDDSYDSQVYALDMTPYLPRYIFAGDRRFIIAESLRDLVREKADSVSSCEFRITNYPTDEVRCKAMAGNTWQACFASPKGGGYFVYTFLQGSSLMHMTFNRWD